MKVYCISTEGYLFSMKTVKKGNLQKTIYKGIKLGNTYTVYGIILYEGSMVYLLYDNYKMANWYPAELFEVTDKHLPSNWYYQFYGYQEFGVSAVWGYYELVLSEKHYNGICEKNSDEIKVFLKRRKEIDELTVKL